MPNRPAARSGVTAGASLATRMSGSAAAVRWLSGFVVAWFRQDTCWCCWVQHQHPEDRPWPMFEMYVYDPETIEDP